MKILAFVDLHGSHKAMESIKKHSKKADIVVCAGDITIFSNKLDSLLFELQGLEKKVLIIPGNHEDCDDMEKLSKLFDNITDIDNKSLKLDNYLFMGYGDGGFSMIDEKFEKISRKFVKECKEFKAKVKDGKIVLVTHAPPYKTKIDVIAGDHCGNKSIKKFVDMIKPDLVISGHLHENAGKEDKLGDTLIVNPGPYGKIIEV